MLCNASLQDSAEWLIFCVYNTILGSCLCRHETSYYSTVTIVAPF